MTMAVFNHGWHEKKKQTPHTHKKEKHTYH